MGGEGEGRKQYSETSKIVVMQETPHFYFKRLHELEDTN